VKSQSSVLSSLMLLFVPSESEEQVIPSRAALLEQVKNLQPILDSASILGMHFLLQIWPASATCQAVACPVFFFFLEPQTWGQLTSQPGVSKVGTNEVCLLLPPAALTSPARSRRWESRSGSRLERLGRESGDWWLSAVYGQRAVEPLLPTSSVTPRASLLLV